MKLHLIFIWTFLLVIVCQTVEAQKVLLLQKSGTTKRFFYNAGDKITIRTGDPEFEMSGELTYVDDSVMTINQNYSYPLAKVHEVIRTRHFLNGSWRMMFLTAGVYFGGSMFNRAINHDEPLIDNTVPIVCGSFVTLGTLAYLFRHKHCLTEKGWALKVLDYDIFKEKKEVQE